VTGAGRGIFDSLYIQLIFSLVLYSAEKRREGTFVPGYRHELKHRINFADMLILRSRLRAVLQHDSHVGSDGTYRIHSLYFDTPTDTALREKLDSVDRREKFRIRRYNNDTTYLQLEKKSKTKGLCLKEKAPLTAREVRLLLQGDYTQMLDESRPLVVELYAKMVAKQLRPKVIVSYIREPFVYAPGNVRVTLDRDIHTSHHCVDFLCNDIPSLPVGDTACLLEVKYDAFIPQLITDLARIPSRQAAAFSKYAASRTFD
jgi:hypothetical protein